MSRGHLNLGEQHEEPGQAFGLFNKFAPDIKRLTNFEKSHLLTSQFLLREHGNLKVYYAPFDYVNMAAKVVLIGITPGWTQMEIAFREAQRGLKEKREPAEICWATKQQASFAGPMRKNLVAMLDALGLGELLGIGSCESLFGKHRSLLHSTSAIRYPVFVNGRNYTGHAPLILDTPILREFVDVILAAELQRTGAAVVIPLGKAVSGVLDYLIGRGMLERGHCLIGFPHPSGQNGHRRREFEERFDALKRRVTEHFDG